jgi:MFS family permease
MALRHEITPYFSFLLLVATLGPLLFGFHLSELNTPMDVITCKRKSIFTATNARLPQCIEMNPIQTGLISSIFTLGGLCGALASGPFSASRGRLKAIHISTIFFALGPVFEALAPNIGVMTVGRFISGVGAGAAIVVVPIYIAEVSPPAQRGLFGSFTQIMTNFGILFAQLLGYFLSHGQYWRIILAVGGVIGAIQAAGLFMGVESPRWLAEEGKSSRARKVLRKIRGDRSDIEEEIRGWGTDVNDSEEEEETLLAHPDGGSRSSSKSRSNSRKPRLGFLEVIRDPDSSGAVLAVVMIMISQQFTGMYFNGHRCMFSRLTFSPFQESIASSCMVLRF